MRKKTLIFLGVLVLLIATVWWLWPDHSDTSDFTSAPIKQGPEGASDRTTAPTAPPADTEPEVAFPLNAPGHDIRADLRLVSEVIDTFRSNFPHDGNPTGTNAEITAALSGRNKLRFAFVPPRHPAINRDGELCDRWGTPFFFHAESATRMEIRSAGPDRRMWTDDDAVFAP